MSLVVTETCAMCGWPIEDEPNLIPDLCEDCTEEFNQTFGDEAEETLHNILEWFGRL